MEEYDDVTPRASPVREEEEEEDDYLPWNPRSPTDDEYVPSPPHRPARDEGEGEWRGMAAAIAASLVEPPQSLVVYTSTTTTTTTTAPAPTPAPAPSTTVTIHCGSEWCENLGCTGTCRTPVGNAGNPCFPIMCDKCGEYSGDVVRETYRFPVQMDVVTVALCRACYDEAVVKNEASSLVRLSVLQQIARNPHKEPSHHRRHREDDADGSHRRRKHQRTVSPAAN